MFEVDVPGDDIICGWRVSGEGGGGREKRTVECLGRVGGRPGQLEDVGEVVAIRHSGSRATRFGAKSGSLHTTFSTISPSSRSPRSIILFFVLFFFLSLMLYPDPDKEKRRVSNLPFVADHDELVKGDSESCCAPSSATLSWQISSEVSIFTHRKVSQLTSYVCGPATHTHHATAALAGVHVAHSTRIARAPASHVEQLEADRRFLTEWEQVERKKRKRNARQMHRTRCACSLSSSSRLTPCQRKSEADMRSLRDAIAALRNDKFELEGL